LLGNNIYTGPTTVQSGQLVVDGAQGGSDVILSGGSLSGQGTVGSIVASGSTLTPGDPEATDVLTSAGSVGLDSATTFSIRLNGLNAGTDYDQLSVAGAVNLNSDGGSGSTLAVAVGYTAQVGDTYTILTAGGVVSNTFAGLPEGGTITAGGLTFQITYQANGGTAVLLTCVAGPNRNRRFSALPSGVAIQAPGANEKEDWTLAGSEVALIGISGAPGQVPDTTCDGAGASMVGGSGSAFGPMLKTPPASRSGADVAAIDRWFASQFDESACIASDSDHNWERTT